MPVASVYLEEPAKNEVFIAGFMLKLGPWSGAKRSSASTRSD